MREKERERERFNFCQRSPGKGIWHLSMQFYGHSLNFKKIELKKGKNKLNVGVYLRILGET